MGFSDSLGSVSVEIRAKLDRYKRDMKSAVATTQSSAAKMQASMSKFAAANKGAMLGVAAAIGLATRNAVQFADQIDKVSVKTGLTRKSLQGLEFASTQLGFSFQTIETLGFRVTRRMGEAAEGNERVADAFKQAGVALKDTNGEFRDINKVFPELLDNLSKMENTAERNALGVKIFDTEFRTLLPLLEAGAGSIKEMTDKAEELGLIMSDDALKAMVSFGDSTDIVTRQLRALFIEIAGPILGGLSTLVTVLNQLPPVFRIATIAAVAFGAALLVLSPTIAAIGAGITAVTAAIGYFTGAVEEAGTASGMTDQLTALKNLKAELEADPVRDNFRLDMTNRQIKGLESEMAKLETIAKAADKQVKSVLGGTGVSADMNVKTEVTTDGTSAAQEEAKAVQDSMAQASADTRESVRQTFKEAGKYLLQGDFKGALESLATSFAEKMQERLLDRATNGLMDMLMGPSGGGGGGGLLGSMGTSLFSNLGFANGGQPPVGKASMVGERGPEMFVPKSAGTIIPNEALGGGQGSIVMNNSFNGDAISRQEMAMFSAQLRQQIVQETGRRAANGGAFAKQFRRA